jgi:hypothetical protein
MYRWEDNIKIELTEVGYEGVDWIHLAQYIVQLPLLVNKIVGGGIILDQLTYYQLLKKYTALYSCFYTQLEILL